MAQIRISDELTAQLATTFELAAKVLRGAQRVKRREQTAEEMLAELDAMPAADLAKHGLERKERLRAASPNPRQWAAAVRELRGVPGLTSWRAVCDHLRVEVGRDSARRRLADWVKHNRPAWLPVPEV